MTSPYDDERGQFPPPQSFPPPAGSPYPPQDQPPYAPPPSFPPPAGSFPPPPGYYPPPVGQYPGGFGPTAAPYGYDPQTGEPLSDKSKTVAGLLQLLGLIGVLGVGRMYMGQTGFGVGQLVGCLIFGVVTCGFGFIVPFVWGIVDAIILMTGTPRDGQGRLLRDGT